MIQEKEASAHSGTGTKSLGEILGNTETFQIIPSEQRMNRGIYISTPPLCHWLRKMGDVIPSKFFFFFTSISQNREECPSGSWGKTVRFRCRYRQGECALENRKFPSPIDTDRAATCYTDTFPLPGLFLSYCLRLLPSHHRPLFYSLCSIQFRCHF